MFYIKNMCMKKFVHSRACPYRNMPGPMPGYYYTEKDGFRVAKECDCHIQWRKQNALDIKLKNAGLEADFTFDDYKGEKSLASFKALKEFTDNFQKYAYKTMLYMYGPNGTMKTSMAQACGKQLIENGYTVKYILMNTLLNNLVKSFNDPNQDLKDAFIQQCLNVDLLIIDECFDKSKVTLYSTGYQLPFLDSFLRSRFEMGKKPILFISNKRPDQIEQEGFGPSIESLVKRNTQSSTLEFLDSWTDNANQIDKLGLFKGAMNG